MEKFIDKIKFECDVLIRDFTPQSKEKSIMACQRFNEYMLRLEGRLNQLITLEKEISEFEPGRMERQLKDIQLDFVDKIEAYFQQLYSTLSAFIMLLNHVADDSFRKQMPIKGVERFLLWVSKQSYSSQLKNHIVLLDNARNFRAIFIDHPQQHIIHDWMTYSHLNGTAIIYFIRNGNKVYAPGSIVDPYDPNFKPPFDYKSFYVSPDYRKVHESMKFFVKVTLESIKDKKYG